MKHKPYPKYKDSGVEWLGEVPEEWEAWKIGHLTTKIGSGKTPNGGAEVYQSEGVLFIRSQNVYDEGLRLGDVVYIDALIDAEMAWARVQARDILLNITGASLGRTCIVPQDTPPANVNQHVCIIRMGNKDYADYVSWYLKSKMAKGLYEISQTGSAREGLNFEQISDFPILLPPLSEQQTIAAFLDHKTAKIDALIDKKQELVERLREKRTALISRAVTKGLNSKAKMKPSGVEWLGEVPEGWEVKRLKHFSKTVSKGTTPSTEGLEILSEGSIKFIKAENIVNNEVANDPEFFIDEKTNNALSRSILKANDILIVIAGATIGKVAILCKEHIPANTNQAVCFLRLMEPESAKFLWYCLQSGFVVSFIALNAVQSAQPNLSMGMLKVLSVPLPPLSEQQAIAVFLDRETGKLDVLLTQAEEAIKKLKEYRSALISAAVTGKIDVRDFL
jgi:type I restriction enzyme, S subunit